MYLYPEQKLQNGRYTVDRELGRGRFAITYLATRSDGDRWVIKILDPALLQSLGPTERDRLKTMFWNEGIALARCSGKSPYIVRIDPPFEENGIACLPLEYMGNNTLADRPERILPEKVALEYIRQVGEALAIVHGEKLVHRDIRPGNIFLVPRQGRTEAVLTDFGLVMAFDAELTQTRTQEQIKGFSPIELFVSTGQRVGPYTDVYALAATLYEMLTGKVPVDAFTRKVNRGDLVTPQVHNPEISGKVAKAIMAGMALEPEQRPQTLAAWLKLLGGGEAGFNPDPNLDPKPLVNWEKWGVIWAAVAVILSMMLWVGDKLMPEPDRPQPNSTEQQQP